MVDERRDWLSALIFIVATAGIIGVVLAFNINLARYKLLMGQLSALLLFCVYAAGLLYFSPQNERYRLNQVNPVDLPLLLFLAAGLISYYFVDFGYRDASWLTWFKFFIYGLLYWSLAHSLYSVRLTRKLLDVWLAVSIITCIYGISQYYQVDFFMFLRPKTRLFENVSWTKSFSIDFYITLLILGVGLLWGALLFFYRSDRITDKIMLGLLGWFSYFVILSHFGPAFPKELADRRIFSTFGNANMYSAYLVLLVLVIMGLLAESVVKRNMGRVWFYLATEFIVLLNLILTQTRAGYVALVAGIIIFCLLVIYSGEADSGRKIRLAFKAVGIFLLLCLVSAIIVRFLTPELYEKAMTVVYRRTARLYVWIGAVRMMLAYPITGAGIGTFAVHYPNFRPTELDIYHPTNVYFVRHAHNEFLEIGAEQGLLGLGLFLVMLFVFYRTALKKLTKEHSERFIIIGLLAGIGALLIDNLFSVDMRFVSSAYFFWISLAFTMVLVTGSNQTAQVALPSIAAKKESSLLAAYPILGFVKMGILVLLCSWLVYNGNLLVKPFKANISLQKEDNFFRSEKNQDIVKIKEIETKKEKGRMSDIDFFRLGNLYAKGGDWFKAIKNLEAAVAINPELFGALNNLGNIAFMHRRIEEAIKYYRQAVLSLAKKPKLTPRELREINDAYFNLGFAYFKQGDLDKALEEFNQVLKNNPDHAKALKMRERLIQ